MPSGRFCLELSCFSFEREKKTAGKPAVKGGHSEKRSVVFQGKQRHTARKTNRNENFIRARRLPSIPMILSYQIRVNLL